MNAQLTSFFFSLKRVLDLVLSPLLALALLPVICLICLVLFFENRNSSVLFTQKRIGKGGKAFTIYKFRTMVSDSEELLVKIAEPDSALGCEWAAVRKLQNDPRVTRIGALLRKYSLDELPQLVNVLKGDMTLIGPRPIVSEEISMYGPYFADYCRVRPGLTGLWQVSGRNSTTYEERILLDHIYVTTWSPLMDLKIAIRTLPAIFTGKGAY